MADRSRTSQRQQMAPGTLAVFKAAGHQFGAPASLWFVFSRFGARGSCALGRGGCLCQESDRAPVSALQVLNVLYVGLAADGEARRLQPAHTKLQAVERHDLGRVPADVVHKA